MKNTFNRGKICIVQITEDILENCLVTFLAEVPLSSQIKYSWGNYIEFCGF